MNIDRERIRKILTEDLDIRKVCAKMVPKEFTEGQRKEESQFAKTFWRGKMTFWAMSSQLMKHGSTNTTLKRRGKVHDGRLPIPTSKKKFVGPNQKVTTILQTFYIRGIVHYEFVPTGQTVNQVYYLEILERLRENVRRKRLELFANNSWILHYDNAPAHMALSVWEFLATKQITVLEHCLFTGSSTQ